MSGETILVLDIGGTHVKCGAVTAAGTLTCNQHFPTSRLTGDDPIGALAAIIAAAAAELRVTPTRIVSTIPGFLDPDHDLVHFAGNIQNLNNRRVARELAARTGLPVTLERDAVMSLLGEWLAGAAQGAETVLGLFFGTGVGGAFLQRGKPFRGSGYALEIGNMPFKGEGRVLPGRRQDCLETYVSGAVLQAMAARHGVAIAEVFTAQNPALAAELDGFLNDLVIAVGMGVALFSPDCILLGGGLCDMAGFPRERVARGIAAQAPYAEMGREMDLRWAQLGWEAVLAGAAHVARAGIESL